MNVIWKENELFFKHPDILRITFDSRDVLPGDMFIALKGNNFDGHDFVEEAMKKGAVCALVERYVCENNIVVDSCLDTLFKIASIRRSMFRGQVIGITGSVGKSTTRYSLVKTLEQKFKVFNPTKNFNSLLGVSFSLAQFPLDVDFVVMEIGMSKTGEIAKLAQLVLPHLSLLTHVTCAHIDELGSLFAILKEKAHVFDFTSQMACFAGNSWYSGCLKKYCSNLNLPYSVFASDIDSRVSLLNSLRLVIRCLNLDLEPIVQEISGRRDLFSIKKNYANLTIIDSSYNANFASMIEEIRFLKSFNNTKIAILGDMGGLSRRHHEVLSYYLEGVTCFLCGENMKFLYEKLPGSFYFENVEMLLNFLSEYEFVDAAILVKASNFMKFNMIVKFFNS